MRTQAQGETGHPSAEGRKGKCSRTEQVPAGRAGRGWAGRCPDLGGRGAVSQGGFSAERTLEPRKRMRSAEMVFPVEGQKELNPRSKWRAAWVCAGTCMALGFQEAKLASGGQRTRRPQFAKGKSWDPLELHPEFYTHICFWGECAQRESSQF